MYKVFSGVMLGISLMFLLLGELALSATFIGLAIMIISLDGSGSTSTKKEIVS